MELETAQDWGQTPWGFDALERDEKAEMMAFVWTKRNIEAFAHEQIEKKYKLKESKRR